MEPKRKRRTRERILETALMLFNELGEPNVALATIAFDTDISPGNLHYHFRSKEKLVEELFAAFKGQMDELLVPPPPDRPVDGEDVWLFLHLLFETIFRYRFLYRDLNDLLGRHRQLEVQFKRILRQKTLTAAAILQSMARTGGVKAERSQIESLAVNMALIATYWLSFDQAARGRASLDADSLARGAVQVMSLAAPFLSVRERLLFEHLSQRYLS
jgi:AcrR family transcriptional regulator